jgi:hypothetical protein
MSARQATRPAPDMLAVRRPFTPVQWTAVAGALAILLWSVPGMIANPDFSVGRSATAVRVLGVDMNGWHALSGFLVAIPALILAPRPHLAARYNLFAAAALVATGIWALLNVRLAGGLLYFPNNEADAILHFATAAIFAAGSALYFAAARGR